MMVNRIPVGRAALVGAMLVVLGMHGSPVSASEHVVNHPLQLTQAGGTEPRELEPRYKPAPVEEKGWYNDSYIFGMTRGVAESTMHPAAKVPLFALTVPLDLVLLPFAALGGLFG